MVRQALADAQPRDRKRTERERPVVGAPIPFINAILEADRKSPRKQRHTAHRIFARILAEQFKNSCLLPLVLPIKLFIASGMSREASHFWGS